MIVSVVLKVLFSIIVFRNILCAFGTIFQGKLSF